MRTPWRLKLPLGIGADGNGRAFDDDLLAAHVPEVDQFLLGLADGGGVEGDGDHPMQLVFAGLGLAGGHRPGEKSREENPCKTDDAGCQFVRKSSTPLSYGFYRRSKPNVAESLIRGPSRPLL
jgi:hypothetical protein